MNQINIQINTENSAFEEMDGGYELARIMGNLKEEFEQGNKPIHIMDINGNTVGKVRYK